MKRERVKSTIAVILIGLIVLLAGWLEVAVPAGQQCNWQSDCGYNETCRPLKYYQRDDTSYRGICVPKEW